jgi:hypothetical protein
MDLGQECHRFLLWTATAKPSSNGDVLFALYAEGDRMTLNGGPETSLPQCVAISDVDGTEAPIIVANEGYAPSSG